ncbi:ski2-like helicase [bacterium BMS3Bbin10]|nr:ski2-like helicase [bacterium BMS3Bbin10]
MSDYFSSGRARHGRGVTAVLGPTNTGKTHLAIERMLGHESGIIGLPLRLLAREVYDKVVRAAGAANVALITGEEKIYPKSPRYYVCTVEAMPRDIDVAFLAVDEIQLAGDPERGHVFTRHLLHARGQSETLLLGAATMKGAIIDLLPGANIISRPRLSKLSYAGQKKISRLPRRSAVVTFAANEVYAIAELMRRQRGGAAVVLGALSPKTRNAQVELYQNGEVDFLIATDAIGMGLNLDVDHVALASVSKFDGQQHRELTNAEIGQVAGRAGRHTNDGSFGVTAQITPFEQARIAALEAHEFEPVKMLQWRNGSLDFTSVDRLKDALRAQPDHKRLTRGRMVNDLIALENVSSDEKVKALAIAPAAIARLWEVCQIPDYRKISAADHAAIITQLYCHLLSENGHIPEDWFTDQLRHAENTSGDIDTLANRISHIRTWTFVSHRSDWLADPGHWQERTRAIEDKLSDALHERLTQRFVDRRTSVLMKSMRDKQSLHAEIEADGSVHVERHFVGRLDGFLFTPDTSAAGIHGKAARNAAAKVLSEELAERAKRLVEAAPEKLELTRLGQIMWENSPVARLEKGSEPLKPSLTILADEHLSAPEHGRIEARISDWLNGVIDERLEPLVKLAAAEDISGLAKGVAFQLLESLGALKRDDVADDIRQLDQEARGQLRRYGVRFGAFNIFMPMLLKPAASDLILLLWALHHGARDGVDPGALPEPPRQGLTSAAADPKLPQSFYRAAGFHHCGRRVVRFDMLERLADMIRPLVSWRRKKAEAGADVKAAEKAVETEIAKEVSKGADPSKEEPKGAEEAGKEGKAGAAAPVAPEGATGDGGFTVTPDMTSIIGCSGEEFASVLTVLGFRRDRKAPKPEPRAEKANPDTARREDGKAAPAAAEKSGDGARRAGAQMDEVWRPRRKTPRAAAHKGRGRKPKPARGKGKAAPMRAARPKPEPRAVIDPDSPFAALKDLKRDLETRVKDPS